jgi:hypothetical protein
MNISYPPMNFLPAIGHEIVKAATFLLIPTELLYFSIYFHTKGQYKLYEILTFLSVAAFWTSPVLAPISCGHARCLQNFTSTPPNPLPLDKLTMCSCHWHNEDPRYLGPAAFSSNLHRWQETCGLAVSSHSHRGTAIRVLHPKPYPRAQEPRELQRTSPACCPYCYICCSAITPAGLPDGAGIRGTSGNIYNLDEYAAASSV